ncbi:transposase [Microbacterium sp. LRZ72]|nr:transposase [Microbacterium sp. LRZ72]MDX2377815.1 transposase [Microbacterium sp. LRZ72]
MTGSRSRGGLTTKLHLVCDGRGRPLGMMITGGNINDTTMMTAVLEDIRVPCGGKGRPRTRPDRLLADKGYPSKMNRAWLREHGIAATIPERDDHMWGEGPRPGPERLGPPLAVVCRIAASAPDEHRPAAQSTAA